MIVIVFQGMCVLIFMTTHGSISVTAHWRTVHTGGFGLTSAATVKASRNNLVEESPAPTRPRADCHEGLVR